MARPAYRPWNVFEDRCDGCGAEAFVRVSKLDEEENVLQLLFCGHHAKRYVPILLVDWFLEDFTDLINAEAMSGAAH